MYNNFLCCWYYPIIDYDIICTAHSNLHVQLVPEFHFFKGLPVLIFSEANGTGVDFDKLMGTQFVAALPEGQAVAHISSNDTVVRVDNFQIVRDLYTATDIKAGLQIQGSNLFVVHGNGHVVEMRPQDGFILQVYKTGIRSIRNFGSHHTDLCDIDLNLLLFASWYLGEVYSYNISSQTKKVHVDNLQRPMAVTYGCVNGSVVYVVTEHNAHKIHVYNSTWSLIISFGGLGSGNGQLNAPVSAILSNQGHIFVADQRNHRVSMFTSDGQFVKHIITYDTPYYQVTDSPKCLSLRGRYLWITTSNGRLTRYIL